MSRSFRSGSRAVLFAVGSLFTAGSVFAAGTARAHHPSGPAAPHASAPYAIGGLTELSLSLEAVQFRPPSAESVSTMLRLRAGGLLWLQPWLGFSASVPLQMLRGPGESSTGLGNGSVGVMLRAISRSQFEIVASTELRLPTFSDAVGARSTASLFPQLVVAHHGRVTSYAGASVAIALGSSAQEDPFSPAPPTAEPSEHEVSGFFGASLSRKQLEVRGELRASRPIGESAAGLYVGALVGAGIRLGVRNTVRATVEVPIRSGDRMRWSGGLSFTQLL